MTDSRKQCSRCRNLLPVAAFPKNRSMTDGLGCYCSGCSLNIQRIARGKRKALRLHGHLATVTQKKCSRCQQILSETEFSPSAASPDGLYGYCRPCNRNVQKEYAIRRQRDFDAGVLSYPDTKHCPQCKETKPSTAFGKMSRAKDGLQPKCRKCQSANNCSANRTRKFGLSEADMASLIHEQYGRCAICDDVLDVTPRANGFHIDHDHDTGIVRGILCPMCNVGLGMFSDKCSRIDQAMAYLAKHSRP
jgi:hypothetical protein